MDDEFEMSGGEPIGPGGVSNKITVTADALKEHNFETLEHVTVRVWIDHSKRGDVSVELLSPNGIKSALAAPRAGDIADTGFQGWRFMTVKHWYVTSTPLSCPALILDAGKRTLLESGRSGSSTSRNPDIMGSS